MKKILTFFNFVAMAIGVFSSNIVVNSSKQQTALTAAPLGKKVISLANKLNNLQELKINFEINSENILIFKDKVGNIFYEEDDSIYMLKKDWLSAPVKLEEIRSKVKVIAADNYNHIYFGSEDGIYKRNSGLNTITKINIEALNQTISFIVFDRGNNMYVATEHNVYRLENSTQRLTMIFDGWVNGLSFYNNILYIAATNGVYKLPIETENVIELPNEEHYDENKLLLFYPHMNGHFNKSWDSAYSKLKYYSRSIYKKSKQNKLTLKVLHTFKLGTTNPLLYNRIEFLGNPNSFYSKISWGNDAFYGKKPNEFNGTQLKTKILNKKLVSNHFIVLSNDHLKKCFKIQDFYKNYNMWGNQIWGKQYIILSYYFENGSYYLQYSIAYNVLTEGLSESGGGIWMYTGYGISLYND